MKISKLKTCKTNANEAVDFPEGIFVLAFMDSITEKKSMRPFDCLLNWKEEFETLSIPVYIVTPQKHHFREDGTFFYLYDESLDCFRAYEVLKSKSVFGKEHEVIYASMYVMDQGKMIYKVQSITNSSLKKLLIYLSKEWVKKFRKKVEKKFDNT